MIESASTDLAGSGRTTLLHSSRTAIAIAIAPNACAAFDNSPSGMNNAR